MTLWNCSRSLVRTIKQMAADALYRSVSSPFRLIPYLPSSSFLSSAHFRHVSKICRTVIVPVTQAQHSLFTLGTRRSVRKALKSILLVLSYISSALSALSLPLCSIRVPFNSASINTLKYALFLFFCQHLVYLLPAIHLRSTCELLSVISKLLTYFFLLLLEVF
jgi:hypothetical protein